MASVGNLRDKRPLESSAAVANTLRQPQLDDTSVRLDEDGEEKPADAPSTGSLENAELAAKEAEMLEKVTALVDTEYDIIKAEHVFRELEALLSSNAKAEAWENIVREQLFARFKRKMEYFMDAGRACSSSNNDWFLAWEDGDRTRSIHGCLDPSDKRKLSYRVYAQIPTSLANVMAVANEVELLPEWNSLVVAPPQVIGRRTAHYMILNYQMSLLGGMQKLDILNEVRRFSDPVGGFLAEYIETVPEGHAAYKAPASGYKRPKTLLKNMWVACGPNHTVLIQVGKLDLPVTLTQWWATKIGGIAGRALIGGLVKNSMRSTEPGNPWAKALNADPLGLYGRMEECINSEESGRRSPQSSTPDKVEEFDLRPWFNRRYNGG